LFGDFCSIRGCDDDDDQVEVSGRGCDEGQIICRNFYLQFSVLVHLDFAAHKIEHFPHPRGSLSENRRNRTSRAKELEPYSRQVLNSPPNKPDPRVLAKMMLKMKIACILIFS
jgi:hypothetical protein